MQGEELNRIRERVREVGERIQPLLRPIPGFPRRNAPAHTWLGIREVFGEEWRQRALPESVLEFLEWIEANPNEEYGSWPGAPRFREGWFPEQLFGS